MNAASREVVQVYKALTLALVYFAPRPSPPFVFYAFILISCRFVYRNGFLMLESCVFCDVWNGGLQLLSDTPRAMIELWTHIVK